MPTQVVFAFYTQTEDESAAFISPSVPNESQNSPNVYCSGLFADAIVIHPTLPGRNRSSWSPGPQWADLLKL